MRKLVVTALIVMSASTAALALTWIRDMWTGPVVLPQMEARTPPDHALAVDGPRIMNRRDARLGLTSPLDATAEVLSQGAELYATYCALCHGATGMGDGQLAPFYRRMPDLTARYVLNYPEGFVYSIIREGGRNMPRFADSLQVDERWALVRYLQTLAPAETTAR